MTLKDFVSNSLSIEFENKLMIFDYEEFFNIYNYSQLLLTYSFKIFKYDDVEKFRLVFEEVIQFSKEKYAVLVMDNSFIPYDIRKEFCEINLSLRSIFPKLDESELRKHILDLEVISYTYSKIFTQKMSKLETQKFIEESVFTTENIRNYLNTQKNILENRFSNFAGNSIKYTEWYEIAKLKSTLELYSAMLYLDINLSFIDDIFLKFVMSNYSELSTQTVKTGPSILPKVLEYIAKDKVALIVLDGMSLFDFQILSRYFDGIQFDFGCSFALVPSTTATSRQSLLSGKYPVQLVDPFTLSNEDREFYNAVTNLGYLRQQVALYRSYSFELSPLIKFLAVVLNDTDDIVHGQQQGRHGMFQDITLFSKSGKLQSLIKSLFIQGFKVYLTSDHGNTMCKGIGTLRNTGIEVETRSKRTLILKDFAQIDDNIKTFTFAYPGFYLNKNFKYLICKEGISFDNKDNIVMTHGGTSIDELIVPFVKIKGVQI